MAIPEVIKKLDDNDPVKQRYIKLYNDYDDAENQGKEADIPKIFTVKTAKKQIIEGLILESSKLYEVKDGKGGTEILPGHQVMSRRLIQESIKGEVDELRKNFKLLLESVESGSEKTDSDNISLKEILLTMLKHQSIDDQGKLTIRKMILNKKREIQDAKYEIIKEPKG